MTFTCDTCGKVHDLAEISFGTHAPDPWGGLTDAERAISELGDETCITRHENGEQNYFIRARIILPIRGTARTFEWGVWCSLSERSFNELTAHWYDPARTKLGPHFGWLCTRLSPYPNTVLLKTLVHQQPVGVRPTVELEPTDHPLAVQQRDGIDPADLQAMVRKLLHEGESTT
jgi:hypothetical protein